MAQNKILLQEIDRENWRYILYKSETGDIYGDYVYSPKSFIDLSFLIQLRKDEILHVNQSRKNKLDLADYIRFNHQKYSNRSLNKKDFILENRPVYSVKTIDLNYVESIDQLHNEIQSKLNMPEGKRKNWDAFWDCITGSSKLPSNLIFYNYIPFSEKFKDDGAILGKLIIDFKKVDSELKLQLDHLQKIDFSNPKYNLKTIFDIGPHQYGWRGDIHLWEGLKNRFSSNLVIESEDHLIFEIHETIFNLTGHRLQKAKDFFVEKYSTGGISSGKISADFWLELGIPILLGRFKKIKE